MGEGATGRTGGRRLRVGERMRAGGREAGGVGKRWAASSAWASKRPVGWVVFTGGWAGRSWLGVVRLPVCWVSCGFQCIHASCIGAKAASGHRFTFVDRL